MGCGALVHSFQTADDTPGTFNVDDSRKNTMKLTLLGNIKLWLNQATMYKAFTQYIVDIIPLSLMKSNNAVSADL